MSVDVAYDLANHKALIHTHFERLVPPTTQNYSKLIEAARYSLLNGGKRVRPLFVLAAAETFGAEPDKALSTACAIEMIHTYSLIHDDLPCMDDDDFRRGKPSLHKAFDEAHAVLAGDYLLTRAFEVVSTDEGLTAEQRVRLISLITANCGAHGMVGGQSLDMCAEGKDLSLEELQQLHSLKTGALITASILAGAYIGDANQEECALIKAFGDDLGLAFQIFDDVLDVTQAYAKRGTTQSSDLINNKTTYVTLLGVDKANQAANHHLDQALQNLAKLNRPTGFLKYLALSIKKKP